MEVVILDRIGYKYVGLGVPENESKVVGGRIKTGLKTAGIKGWRDA